MPSLSRPRELERRQESPFIPVTSAHLNSRALHPPNLRHCLADGARDQFLSGRCVRSKVGASPTPDPSLLRGPAVFERLRRRARSRWATPHYPVRRSRPDTCTSLVRADGVLLERAAGPLSRCPSTLAMAPTAIDTYSAICAWLPATMWPLEVAARSACVPRVRFACVCRSSERDDTSGSTSRVHSRVCH